MHMVILGRCVLARGDPLDYHAQSAAPRIGTVPSPLAQPTCPPALRNLVGVIGIEGVASNACQRPGMLGRWRFAAQHVDGASHKLKVSRIDAMAYTTKVVDGEVCWDGLAVMELVGEAVRGHRNGSPMDISDVQCTISAADPTAPP